MLVTLIVNPIFGASHDARHRATLHSAELAEAQEAASAAREQATAAAERHRAQAEDWAHARQQLQTANEEVRHHAARTLR